MKLEKLFKPRGVAVIGASRKPHTVGHGVLKSLVKGGVMPSEYNQKFPRKIYAVNPKASSILGVKSYNNVSEIKGIVDLVVICVPAKIVLPVVKDCIKKKVKYAIVISAGLGETGGEGKILQEKIVETAKKGGLRIVGPNCLGIIDTYDKLNASFAPTMPPKGPVSFITQSGALADSIIDWATKEEYGLDKLISVGNQADLEITDFLEHLAQDKKTKAIAMYIEGLKDGRRFLEVAKKVNKIKPIIVLKAGRSKVGTEAVGSHTGSLAGSYEIHEAAFRQAGLEVVHTLERLLQASKALATQPHCEKNSIAIITNGGGCGILCADACEKFGVNVVKLKESTLKKLDKSGKMHPAYSRHNPLDIVGDALPDRYSLAIDTLLSEKYISGLIVIQTLQTMTRTIEDAKIVIDLDNKYPDKPIICSFMGGKYTAKAIKLLKQNNVPNFQELTNSARVMKALINREKVLKARISSRLLC